MNDETGKKKGGITPLGFIGSLFAGWFGVQTEANRQRDFEHGKFSHFIIGGIIFAILFVLFVVAIVQVVLKTAGSWSGQKKLSVSYQLKLRRWLYVSTIGIDCVNKR